jgi:hypothetical protein
MYILFNGSLSSGYFDSQMAGPLSIIATVLLSLLGDKGLHEPPLNLHLLFASVQFTDVFVRVHVLIPESSTV